MKRSKLAIFMVVSLGALLALSLSMGSGYAREPGEQDPLTDIASDILPPVLTVVSPVDGQVVTTNRPVIEVVFEDTGSGIDETTLQLAVDGANVTAQSTISSGRVTYRPDVPLAGGTHEAYFGVRDRAGNLAEVRWRFEVSLFFEGMKVGGTNTLEVEWYPISKVTDTLGLTLQARVASSDIRLSFSGRGTNYPGGTPLLSYGEYNAYLDRYSIEVRRGNSAFATGYTTLPLATELFQVSRDLRGAVANTAIYVPAGQHSISAFHGKVASSSGLGLSVWELTGITERWQAKSGLALGGIAASLGGGDGYYFLGVDGRMRVGNASLRFEATHGASKIGDGSGSGIVAHLDVPFTSLSLGFDLAMLQPGYPLPGTPASLSPIRGGALQYGLRAMTRVLGTGVLTINSALTRDNLDGSAPYTLNRGNLAANYYHPLAGGWSLRAAYQYGFKQSDGLPVRIVDSVSGTTTLTASGRLGAPERPLSLQAEGSVGSAEDRISGKSSRTAKLSGSCAMSLGPWSLSPSLELSRQETLDTGTRTDSANAKVTASGGIISDVLRGTLTLFRTGSDSFKAGYLDPAQRRTETGFETAFRLAIPKWSTLSFIFKNSWWTQEDATFKEGQNRTQKLEWSVRF